MIIGDYVKNARQRIKNGVGYYVHEMDPYELVIRHGKLDRGNKCLKLPYRVHEYSVLKHK